MRAFVLKKYGKSEKLEWIATEMPFLKANEVLVKVHAAGLNPLDVKVKSGDFKMVLPYKLPLILGYDFAGVVVKVGRDVTAFGPGDEVFGRASRPGTLAEFVSTNQSDIARKPSNLTMTEAASIPLVALTAWQAFVQKANLGAGQKVFIQAGSGGVGTIAIQLAKHLGAFVATTASKPNFDFVKNLGADLVIDYKTQDFAQILGDYDVVLNSQDAKTLEKSIGILKPNGTVVSLSGPPDVDFAKENNLSWLMRTIISLLSRKVRKLAKKRNVNYHFLFMQPSGEQLSKIASLLESGKIKPVIDKVFAFGDTNQALDYVQNGRAKGKVVVEIG